MRTVLQEEQHALGSKALLTIVVADMSTRQKLMRILWQQISAFEKRFSRFLPDSELTLFNHGAGRRTAISPAFRGLLLVAKQQAEQTGGLYNPFILPALQRAGYKGSWPHPAQASSTITFVTATVCSADKLVVGNSWARIPANAALDFGGCGKGYLLDQLATLLEDNQAVKGYWLSLGGDIVCGGCDARGQEWEIGIAAAQWPEKAVATRRNLHGDRLAIATSGITKRRGFANGKAWHHIINPHTGQPAETDILTASVCAKQAIEADVYAKCLVLLGWQNAKCFITDKHITSAIIQREDSRGTIAVEELQGMN